jgi:hypothetical protein
MFREPRLVMVEVTDAYGHVEAEPLVVQVDEAGWVRFELHDGTVMRCPWDEVAAAAVSERRAA